MAQPKALVLAVGMALAGPALADDAELARIREQIRQLKESYEARIDALEKRLTQAEAAAGQAQAAAQASRRPTGENAFNPAISLILSGTYGNFSQDPDNYRIGGFIPAGREAGPGRRGFSLGESELFLSASVDPYFRGSFTLAVTPENEVEVEEAFVQTLGLGRGLTLKAGRFFSGIGYLNEIHPHAWDFVDAPLAYQAFLGRQLGDDGIQLRWVAPTETFLELGAEAGRGGSFPGADRNKNGAGAAALFVHAGGDLGESIAWRAGASYYAAGAVDRDFADADGAGLPVVNRFAGDSRLWVADFVMKYAPGGNPARTHFKLQGEYLRRRESGTLTFDSAGRALADSYQSSQSGWYLQGVYQFLPRWRAGLRYDRLDSGTPFVGQVASGALTSADFPGLAAHIPKRSTVMLDWNPSEFSRVRLQYARDEARPGITDHQVFFQYLMSLGAHGAHKF